MRFMKRLGAVLACGAACLMLAVSCAQAGGVDAQCRAKGKRLYGKVKVVKHFGDVKVQVVNHFPDLKVQKVRHFPDRCGKWQFVDSFPDFTVEFVDHFPDVKIQYVNSFPGRR